MADYMDKEQERQQQLLDMRIKAATNKAAMPAAHECDECGEQIPEARRRTVPGVRLCIDCKSLQEARQHTHR
ncbi:TraR/DksA C4-type zinc finger protein [Serratia rubidaea]|uniref:TraR/DksA C4-type zinc finger protein n=1 Tax=Serratia rubidaea TaxID=61652 RepID=UPI00242AC815|nr:TraR/DksA C4-type zinc finger protein [Serratia rubidaea]